MIITSLPLRLWFQSADNEKFSRFSAPLRAILWQFFATFTDLSRRDVFEKMHTNQALGNRIQSAWVFANPFKWFEFIYAVVDGILSRGILSLIALAGLPTYLITKGLVFFNDWLSELIEIDESPLAFVFEIVCILFLPLAAFLLSKVTLVIHGILTLAYTPFLLGLNLLRMAVNAITSPIETFNVLSHAIATRADRVTLAVSSLFGVALGVVICMLLPIALPFYLSGLLVAFSVYCTIPAVLSTKYECQEMWEWLAQTHMSHAQCVSEFSKTDKWFIELQLDPSHLLKRPLVMSVPDTPSIQHENDTIHFEEGPTHEYS